MKKSGGRKVKTPTAHSEESSEPSPSEFTFDTLPQDDSGDNVLCNQAADSEQSDLSAKVNFIGAEVRLLTEQFSKLAPLINQLSTLSVDESQADKNHPADPVISAPSVPAELQNSVEEPAVVQQPRASFSSNFPAHFSGLEFTPHEFYWQYIDKGFADRRPLYCNIDKPHVYRFDDPVTRALTGTKYSAKLSEYMLISNYGYFVACANAEMFTAVDEIENTMLSGENSPAIQALRRVLSTYKEIEELLRERIFFLATQSDPAATTEDKDFNNHVARYFFQPDPRDQGMPSRLKEHYDNYKRQVAQARANQAAKEEAKRQIKGGGTGGGGTGGGGSGSGGSGGSGGGRGGGGSTGGGKGGKTPTPTPTSTTTTVPDKKDTKADPKGGKAP